MEEKNLEVKNNKAEQLENENVNAKTKKKNIIPIVMIILLVIVICIIGGIICFNLFLHKEAKNISEEVETFIEEDVIGTEGEVTTVSKASLEKVFNISELQTADYIFNAVKAVYDTDGTTLKYYVAYEGTVTAGIDFSNIDIEISDEEKMITINLPDVTIQETVVNAGTLKYIFEKKKYDTEEVFKEAYGYCQVDLDNRAENDEELLNLAKENAKQVIEAMITPWVDQLYTDYSVVVE